MKEFKVIDGGLEEERRRKEEKRKFLLEKYKYLYEKHLYGIDCDCDTRKAVLFGIKYVNLVSLNKLDYKELLLLHITIKDLKTSMSFLTYNDLLKLFPVAKEFDGHKFECKDYYTTAEYLSNKNLNDKIGLNNIDDLLWYYYNHELMNFSVKEMLIFDRMMRLNGDDGLLEGFLKHIGAEDKVHSYSIRKDKKHMTDNVAGETFDISVPNEKEKHPEFQVIENKQHT